MSGNQQISKLSSHVLASRLTCLALGSEDAKSLTGPLSTAGAFGVWGLVFGLAGGLFLGYNMFLDQRSESRHREEEEQEGRQRFAREWRELYSNVSRIHTLVEKQEWRRRYPDLAAREDKCPSHDR